MRIAGWKTMLNRIRLSLILCVTLVLNLPAAAQQVGSSTPESTETAAEYYEKALIANNLGETRTAYIYLKNALKEDRCCCLRTCCWGEFTYPWVRENRPKSSC